MRNSHEHAGDVAGAEPACDFLWGVAEIGQVIGRNPRQTFHLISKGELKSVKKLGGRWVVSRAALLRELSPRAAKVWMHILVIASESDNLELLPPDLLFIKLRSTGDVVRYTFFTAVIDELIQCRFLLKTTPELQSFRVPEIQRRKDKRQSPAREAPQGFASPAQCVLEGQKEKRLSEEERETKIDRESPDTLAQPKSSDFPTSGFVPRATSTTTPTHFTYEEAQARGLGPPVAPRFEKPKTRW